MSRQQTPGATWDGPAGAGANASGGGGARGRIRVLIVDDSAVIRKMLSSFLSQDPDFEVVAVAPDPYIARDKLVALRPDVMTLDVEMPRMDGLTFLEKVMRHLPTRTVIISSLTQRGSELALRALELGALDVIPKPAINVVSDLTALAEDIRRAVRNAAFARVLPPPSARPAPAASTVAVPVAAHAGFGGAPVSTTAMTRTTHQICAIASSTGGTEAVKEILCHLPADIFGTLIVQHMPPVFTRTFAQNLARLCPFEVKEAVDGDRVHPGRVLIAPGNYHMVLVRSGAQYFVKLNQDPPQHGVRPAADPLFESVARIAGRNAVGVILTGMGRDGARGLLSMREAGATTVAQDEATSVVYGMPKEAVNIGAASSVLPLPAIAPFLVAELRKRSA